MTVSVTQFSDPLHTATGAERASVPLESLKTLWFNTGTLCNLACQHCYIESSPTNDQLAFLTETDVQPYLREIRDRDLPTELIGLTGGEPFLNPHIVAILRCILAEGFTVLVLTNAYGAIKKHREALLDLKRQYGDQLRLRVSLDAPNAAGHEQERGEHTFAPTVAMLRWLVEAEFPVSIAGRSRAGTRFAEALAGYQALCEAEAIPLILGSHNLVVFPEMGERREVPEITTACWSILGKSPSSVMCAHERMIVKRRGADQPVVLPCTLLAYDRQFELGHTLKDAEQAVYLNHPFCSQFCVLGGSSCSSVR